MSDAVQTLRNLQDDAHQNHWSVVIPQIQALSQFVFDELQFRITTTGIPSSGSESYEAHYKGDFILKTTPKVTMTKEFSFNFRVDQNWLAYTYMKTWKNLVMDINTGTKLVPDEEAKTPITIILEDGSGNPLRTVVFEGARVTDLGEIPLDYSAGDPITIDVTMTFDRMNDLLL